MQALIKSTLLCSLVISGLIGFSRTEARADDCRAAPISGIDWQECDKKLLMLGGSDLTDAKLMGTDFPPTDMRTSTLVGANLEKAKLVRAPLAGSTATSVRFAKVEAYRTDFSGIDADDATFEG